MSTELRINCGVGEIRIAVVRDGSLAQFLLERTLDEEHQQRSQVGNIVIGRVEKVVPAMNAAFVSIGLERAGFLGWQEAQVLGGETISQCVHEGQALLLQVIKDPVGEKGARLSASISLAGRLGVLTPGKPGVVVSRRIEDASERQRLAQAADGLAPDGMGLILRTAAIGASRDDLMQDVSALAAEWKAIAEARAIAKPPATLRRELGLVSRALRDLVSSATQRVLVDDTSALAEARDYCRRAMPHMESRLEMFAGTGGLLDDWEEDIERLQLTRVYLACGGWITIEATEALTAIDVNSGSFVAGGARDETALAVNLQAAVAIGRQLILRGMGGLFVVDFIHVESERSRDRIIAALEKALSESPSPSRVSPMSELGLVAITRRRTGEPLEKRLSAPCLCCSGTGRIPAEGTMAMAALRRVEAEARANPGRALVLRAAPSVAGWLEDHRAIIMDRLSRRGVSRLNIEAEQQFSREVFDVRIS